LLPLPATIAVAIACSVSMAFAEDVVKSAPADGGATVIYRQVMPDGQIVYSDKPIKGRQSSHAITVEPPIKGNSWTAEASTRPDIPPQVTPTTVSKLSPPPLSGRRKTVDEATSDVIRAEMALEDARKQQQAGVEPLPNERTGTSADGSRLNDAYQARQKTLARAVADAEADLKKAMTERDALRHTR
jgi:hypothetical protein